MSETQLNTNKKRYPLVAVVLSLIMPGLGHIYCGKIARGIILAFLQCVLIPAFLIIITLGHSPILIATLTTSILASTAIFLFAIIDSWRTAKHTSESYILKDYNRWYMYLILVLMGTGSSMAIALHLRAQIIEAFRVPSASGYPTIVPNDRIIANKLAYKSNDPKRGDTVVFINPENRRMKYIKRVVAIAGDTVEMKNNELYINSNKLERRQLPISVLDKVKIETHGRSLEGDMYEETNGNAKYKIFIAPDSSDKLSNVEKITVPKHHCFVLGDNRSHSYDSRDFGAIPLATVVGRVDYLYWPAKDWLRIGKLN